MFGVIICCLGWLGCEENKPAEHHGQKLTILLAALQLNKEPGMALIIVPVNGCSGCMYKIKQFLYQKKRDYKTIFIFSGYGLKSITLQLDHTIRSRPDVVLDPEAKAITLGLVGEFPVMYLVKSENDIGIIEINARNIDKVLAAL